MSDIIRRCKDCGAVLPENAGSNRRLCDACRKIKRKEINHVYNMRRKGENCENPPVVRHCSVCGKALPAGSAANRKYCLACSEKAHLSIRELVARTAAKACTEGEVPSWRAPQGGQTLQRVRHDDVRRGSRQNVLRCL